MATEPKIVRQYRKVLESYGIDLAEWHYSHSKNAHIRLTLKRGAVTAHQTINHSDTEVSRPMIAAGKKALNKAAQQ